MFSFGVSLVLVKIVPVIAQLQLQSPLTYLECVFDILSVCFVFWRVSGVSVPVTGYSSVAIAKPP